MPLGADPIGNTAKDVIEENLNNSAQTNAGSNAKNSLGKKFNGRLNGGFDLKSSNSAKFVNSLPDIKALGASDYSGIGTALSYYVEPKNLLNDLGISNEANPLPVNKKPSSSGRNVSNAAPAVTSDNSVTDDPYAQVYKLIDQYTQKNNEWSAKQAQIDRDWQALMSNTAHQREVADLKAAGLNPVLSAGGSGASTPSGAIGQTDMSSTRAVTDVAMYALEAMSNTAVGVARAGSKKSSDNEIPAGFFGKLSAKYDNNKLFQKAVNTALTVASGLAQKAAYHAFFH